MLSQIDMLVVEASASAAQRASLDAMRGAAPSSSPIPPELARSIHDFRRSPGHPGWPLVCRSWSPGSTGSPAGRRWCPLPSYSAFIDAAMLGMLLLCIGIGSSTAMLATGPLSARYGGKPVIVTSGIALAGDPAAADDCPLRPLRLAAHCCCSVPRSVSLDGVVAS